MRILTALDRSEYAEIVLEHGLDEAVRRPDVQAELRGQGAAAMIDNGPDDMARYMKSETDKWAKVINALGLRAQQTTTGG